jgi:hypothetical protein
MVKCYFIYIVNLLTGAEAAAGSNQPLQSTNRLISQSLQSTNCMISTLLFKPYK